MNVIKNLYICKPKRKFFGWCDYIQELNFNLGDKKIEENIFYGKKLNIFYIFVYDKISKIIYTKTFNSKI